MSETPHYAETLEVASAELAALRTELEHANTVLERVRSLGTVYQPPEDWDYSGQGGPPPIDAYEKIDLGEVAST